MTWIATTRTPAEKAADLKNLKPRDGLTSLSKKERAQFDAAKKALATLLPALDGPAHANISGSEEDVIHVQVARADAA